MMTKNKDRKAKLSSAYHEFSIHRRLFWLVSFLKFAIPCCDFPHDEFSWRQSWVDNLNLEVIQQLYILTASFAPEHRINIQWNTKLSQRVSPAVSPQNRCWAKCIFSRGEGGGVAGYRSSIFASVEIWNYEQCDSNAKLIQNSIFSYHKNQERAREKQTRKE